MAKGDPKVGHPWQRENYDISVEPRELRRDGLPAPTIETQRADRRDPLEYMRQLGFEPTENMSPLQFLLAVTNDRTDLLFKNETRRKRIEGKGGLAIIYRLEAAKSAAKYLEMEMPKLQINKQEESGFGAELQDAISMGNKRVIHRETIIREIERTSPEIPLAPASYPPDFQNTIVNVGHADISEGDTDYDPDRDDAE